MDRNEKSGVKGSRSILGKEVDVFLGGIDFNFYPFIPKSFGEFECSDEYCTERRGLKEGLLIYTLDGTGTISCYDSLCEVSKGDTFIINCDHPQVYKTKQGCSWHFLWIHFVGISSLPFVDNLNKNGTVVVKGEYEKQIRRIYDLCLSLQAFDRHQSSIALNDIVMDVYAKSNGIKQNDNAPYTSSGNKHNGFSDEVLMALQNSAEYIDKYYFNNISIIDLAKKASLSRYYFIRKFSELFSRTPYDYLLSVRILKAKELLVMTNKTVEEIAHEVGFCDAKNLIKIFSKKEGDTPFQYRKKFIFR